MRCPLCRWVAGTLPLKRLYIDLSLKSRGLSALDFDVYAAGEIQSHQSVDRLVGRLENIDKPIVGPELKMLHGLLVDVRTADDTEPSNVRRKWSRTCDTGSRALCRIRNLLGRLVDDSVIIGAEPDSYFDACHCLLFQ